MDDPRSSVTHNLPTLIHPLTTLRRETLEKPGSFASGSTSYKIFIQKFILPNYRYKRGLLL